MKFKRKTFICVLAFSLCWVDTAAAAALAAPTASAQVPAIGDGADAVDWTQQRIDVPIDIHGHWSEPLFYWAVRQHIIDGYPDGTLQPDEPITEAAFIKALYRAFGIALPNQIIPWGSGIKYDWTDGPYRLTEMWHHPTLGETDHQQRLKPITRKRAAALIAASLGVHYEGDDAIAYLMGEGMANSKALTITQFRGADTMTRAEAVQWLRQLTLRGMMTIKPMPAEVSDRGSLPSLPLAAANAMPDFSTTAVTREDFILYGSSGKQLLAFGDTRDDIEAAFGKSEDTDVFDNTIYPAFSAHFSKEGLLDGWNVDSTNEDPLQAEGDSRATNKGIVIGQSTLDDVLAAYGTFGYDGSGMASYWYEALPDGSFKPLTALPAYSDIRDPERFYVMSFLIDNESRTVWFAHVTNLSVTHSQLE